MLHQAHIIFNFKSYDDKSKRLQVLGDQFDGMAESSLSVLVFKASQ